MKLDQVTCYRALKARDSRFDGRFFVGVTTTGIYCRPVCGAQLPGADRCRYYTSAAEAEAAGYRPCLRCRPERAPGQAIVDATNHLAARAGRRIAAGALNGRSIDALASELHVGPRQLRRAIKREYGVPPIMLAQTHRLLTAKRLLMETDLPIGQIAYASGFLSLRRFNALFRERYALAPRDMRRSPLPSEAATVQVSLDYRPPLNWGAMLRFLGARAIPGIEAVEGHRYLRSMVVEGRSGWIAAERAPRGHSIRITISLSLTPVLMSVLERVRQLFDVDAQPTAVESHLSHDHFLATCVARCPGLRVPGAVDGFELALRAILGQQVSAQAATTISGRFAEALSGPTSSTPETLRYWPISAECVADATTAKLSGLGITRARAASIVALAKAVTQEGLQLEPCADVERTLDHLCAIPGIGPWTAQYIAMRALHWPDAFPSHDLVLQKVLGVSARRLEGAAEAWRPWRAYAAMHLWHASGEVPAARQKLPTEIPTTILEQQR